MILQPIRDEHGAVLGYAKMTRDLTEKKQVDDAISLSEERFRALIAAIENYAVILLDADGMVLTWNDGAQQLKGFKSEEIIGQPVNKFYVEEDVQAGLPAQHLKTAASQGRLNSPDGEENATAASFSPM